MRSLLKVSLLSLVAAATSVACSAEQAPSADGSTSSYDTASSARDRKSTSPAPASTDSTADDPPVASAHPSSFDCSGDGIAAFADALVKATRESCTSDGEGVVTNTNYDCMKDPIYKSAPPYPDAAYVALSKWAKEGDNFSGKTDLLMCVDFAFIVTAGVCGKPVNDGDAQIDGSDEISGYTFTAASDGEPQAGDVLVYDFHIAIAAEVSSGGDIRVAEANYLTVFGEDGEGQDTGVVSNTRSDSTDDNTMVGWYRKD